MTNIDPAGLQNRRASTTEAGVAKVARSQELGAETSTPHPSIPAWQSRPQGGGDPTTGRNSHSDPAVSLSASLAKVDLGTTLKATVIGFDTNQAPIIKTDRGVFILDVSGVRPPLDLKVDSQLELKIVAVDHVTEAQLIAKDNLRLSPPPLLNLTLVGVEIGEGEQASAPKLPVTISTGAAPASPAPAQYIPQPAQTAMLSGMANLSPVTLLPSSFLTLRDQQAASLPAPLPETDIPGHAIATQPPQAPERLAAQKTSGIPAILSELAEVLAPMSPAPATESPANPGLKGLVLAATVVSVQAPGPMGDSAAPRLTAGQNILVKIVDTALEADADQSVSKPLTPAIPERNLPAYLTATSPSQGSMWRTGGEIIGATKAEPTAIQIPANQENTAKPAPPPNMTGMLLSTPLGVLRIEAPPNLPLGSRLVIEMSQTGTLANTAANTASPAPQPPEGKKTPPLASYLDRWAAVEDILAALTRLNPALGAGLQARIASPLGNLGNAALFFAKALGFEGGTEQWLGRAAVDTLVKGGHQALIDALKNDLSRMAPSPRDAGPNDWRTLMLPLHDGREIQALPVLIRSFESERREGAPPQTKDKSGKTSDRVTRFVVDVSLSRMGVVQMDGMIKARSFSLIMRTEQALGSGMRTKIRDIFSSALARNQFEGDLVFKQGLPFPLSAKAILNGRDSGAAQAANTAGIIYV